MKIEQGAIDDQYCFACGIKNPFGLHMEVTYSSEAAESTLSLAREYQGYRGVVHGGIVSTLLDEIMAHAVIQHVGQAMTASLTIRFRQPLPLNQPFKVRGWVKEQRFRVIKVLSELRLVNGEDLIATGESSFLLLPPSP
jgi:acyl-coenzyme A thioesterase PaaI-like protein